MPAVALDESLAQQFPATVCLLLSEKALVAVLAEMYVQGVSMRKVKAITEERCGHEFSSATVSRATQALDAELEKFATRKWD